MPRSALRTASPPGKLRKLLQRCYVRYLRRKTRGDALAYSSGIDVLMVYSYLEENEALEEARPNGL